MSNNFYENDFFHLDSVFSENHDYIEYTFDVYRRIYNLKNIHYSGQVPRDLFKNIQKKNFFVLLVIYDKNRNIFLERSIQNGLGWSLPGGAINKSEDIHSCVRRMANEICSNNQEIVVGEIEPIAFLTNEFIYKEKRHTHHGLAFVARMRNETEVEKSSLLGNFVRLDQADILDIDKYSNGEVVKLAMENIEKLEENRIEAEINVNEKCKGRYLIHNLFVKKFILTARFKKRKEFLALLKHKLVNCKRFIDVSCGDSNLVYEVTEKDYEYIVGNDISWSQVNLLSQQKSRIIFTNHNSVYLPFVNDSFDVAYCGNTLHHMNTREELLALFNSLLRVARKIVIVEIEDPSRSDFFPRFLNKFWYKGFLKDVGGAYLSENEFQGIINKCFVDKCEIIFSKFKNIQGTYLIAEIDKIIK